MFFDEIICTIVSPNPMLNQFVTEYRTPGEVNDNLLLYINSVLKGESSQEILIVDSQITLQISIASSDFYSSPDYSVSDIPQFSISTSDFKQIAEAWINYLVNN